MPPLARWFYFTCLRHLLALAPRPVWVCPAIPLAAVRFIVDRDAHRLSAALLAGLDIPPTRANRWRLAWSHCYRREASLVLLVQSARLTPAWAARHIRCLGALPPGGAVIAAPHCAAQFIGPLRLATLTDRLGTINSDARDPDAPTERDPTRRLHLRHRREMHARAYGEQAFHYRHAGRAGSRLLQSGGYLVVNTDNFWSGGPAGVLLGRELSIARGAAWLAARSGTPIVPAMIEPDGAGWRLWLGDPLPPTQECVIAALTASIRRAPGCWERALAMAWLAAPESARR